MMLGIISQMPEAERKAIEAIQVQVREFAKDDNGKIAITLVAMELQEEP